MVSRLILGLALGLFPCGLARATVITTGNGSGNTTEASIQAVYSDFPYWDNVGVRGVGSGVYLGDGWVLTPDHVGVGEITLNGTTYQPVANSTVRFGTATDLVMYQINGDPGLSPIPIVASKPNVATPVVMIGSGRQRSETRSYWRVDDSDPENWIWTPSTASNYDYSGYTTTSTRQMRWGTNLIYLNNQVNGNMPSLLTYFSITNPTAYEAQAVAGDSGGAAFYRDQNGRWVLGGLMQAVTLHEDQPGDNTTAVFGNLTWISDISFYRDAIRDHVTIWWPGDANLDDFVDYNDLLILSRNYGQSGKLWGDGDFTGDGLVDYNDLLLLSRNYNSAAGMTAPQVVPEPTGLAMFAVLASLGLLRRRR